MNQKKRGFTLIELLAVIVILAIIALIAVPVIMNIISKANESAFKDTAYGVIQAGELYFAEQLLEPNGMTSDVTIALPDTTKTLQIKGEVPNGTILITTEGKIAIAVQNGRYCVTKGLEDDKVTMTEDIANCILPSDSNQPGSTLSDLATTSSEVTSKPACLTDGTICTAGTPVAIKVNASEKYNFYIIEDTGSEATLIMDRNLGVDIAWYNDRDEEFGEELNDMGPITALNYLNQQTINWTNIHPIKNYIYNNNLNGTTRTYGYQKLEIENGVGKATNIDGTIFTMIEGESRARLLTWEEAEKIYISNNSVTPTYLYTNLKDETGNLISIGYWFLTTAFDDYPYYAAYMDYDGLYDCYYCARDVFDDSRGIRPVITLTKK